MRICRLGKTIPERFSHRYYDAVTVGIDFTARDLQKKLKEQGLPWELSKSFDGAAALGSWIEKDKFLDIQRIHFHLDINGKTVQEGCTSDMLYKVDEIVATLVSTYAKDRRYNLYWVSYRVCSRCYKRPFRRLC